MQIGKYLIIFFITAFSSAAFAEYYLVGKSSCDQAYNQYNNTRKDYKDSGAYQHTQFTQYSQYSQSNTHTNYYNFHEKTFNLDLITGDDDPYAYPGMNIDH